MQKGISDDGLKRLARFIGAGEEVESPDIREEVVQFFKDTPNPEDEELHEWAEEHGYDVPKIEEVVYQLATEYVEEDEDGKDKIPGGRADDKDVSEFPKDQIEKGIKVEMEHTDDPALAKEIAKDHLTEMDDYYDRLDEMEKAAEEAKKEAQITQSLPPSMFTKYEVTEDPEIEEFKQYLEENPDAAAWEIRDWAESRGYDPMTLLNYLEKGELSEEDRRGVGLVDYVYPESKYSGVYVDTLGVYNVYTKKGVEAKGYTYHMSDGGLVLQDVGSFFEKKPILLASNGGGISEQSPIGSLYMKAVSSASGSEYELTPEEQQVFNQVAETSYPVGTSEEEPLSFKHRWKSWF